MSVMLNPNKLEKIYDKLKRKDDDDAVDRFNYMYTPAMLFIFGFAIGGKQYFGKPIQCWIPAHFKKQWEDYSEDYCFVENTYFVKFDERFPTEAEREAREINYYQWVAFALVGQAILCMLPKLLWSAFCWKTGMSMGALIRASSEITTDGKFKSEKKDDENNKKPSDAARHIHQTLGYLHRKTKGVRHANPTANLVNKKSKAQCYITVLYILMKILNLVNSVGQLYLLNVFLGHEYTLWGVGILIDLYNKRRWKTSGQFPRVTFCDVKVREMGGHMVTNTFQCIIMLNMLNEKVYIFVWFWFVLLSIANACNLVQWLANIFTPGADIKWVKGHLLDREDDLDSDPNIKRFTKEQLSTDGLTALRLIASNCGAYQAEKVTTELFNCYLAKDMIAAKAAIKEDEEQPDDIKELSAVVKRSVDANTSNGKLPNGRAKGAKDLEKGIR